MDNFGPKQPAEEYYVRFDYSNILVGTAFTGEIASATAVSKNLTSGVDESDTMIGDIEVNATSVDVEVKAGTDGVRYKITCLATTLIGEVFELDAKLLIREI